MGLNSGCYNVNKEKGEMVEACRKIKRGLIVGTRGSCADVNGMLAGREEGVEIVGCLLVGEGSVEGVAVLGGIDEVAKICDKAGIGRIYLSLPWVMVDGFADMIGWIWGSGLEVMILPTVGDQLSGRALESVRLMSRHDEGGSGGSGGGGGGKTGGGVEGIGFDLSGLIDREPHPLDEEAIGKTLRGRRVLITGAGGSIGSEIARIVARFEPSKLVLIDRSENALFEIDRKIKREFPELKRSAMLHDVTSFPKTMAMVTAQKPDVVFHAAAHKHVPMMEDHPAAAVENNFYGTRAIADAASANGVDKFVMISTDKAVNPSSVMGATKRMAELYVQHLNNRSETTFCMVRFGNVLGSACSVLPIWEDQIKHGYGVTVTHKEMTRFFMTIPEAAGLVLQSAAMSGEIVGEDGETYAGGGEVFLLDMGKPVNILDLAERFVRRMGLEPYVDVPIKIVGARPGEKLHEELAYDGEDMTETSHASVRLWRTEAPSVARIGEIVSMFDELRNTGDTPGHDWESATSDRIQAALHIAVPEMVSSVAG